MHLAANLMFLEVNCLDPWISLIGNINCLEF